jgi:hypothetical protein
MRKLLTLFLVTLSMSGRADVDLAKLPSQWRSAEPPGPAVSAAKSVGLICERYFIHSESGAGLALYSRLSSEPYSQAYHDGTVAGIIDGYAGAMTKKGKTAEKNEVVRHSGVELVHQESRRDGLAFCTFTQVSKDGIRQVVSAVPLESYGAAVPVILGLFTPVAPPPPSSSTSKFDEAYGDGVILGQAAFVLFFTVLVGGGIGLMIWKARKKKTPPPLPRQG